MLGDFSDAEGGSLKLSPNPRTDADAWYLLGRTKYNENEFAAAISSFEHALTLRPKYVEAENNIGLAWKELNETEKARGAFLASIEWQGNTPPTRSLSLILEHCFRRRTERAGSDLSDSCRGTLG